MQNQSDLDKKYFIDVHVYNCPFCNRRNVRYDLEEKFYFDWSNEKKCFVYFVKCLSCKKESMHLSYENISPSGYFNKDIDIDSKIFYSVPTSFFVIDKRIPRILRELITESEGCLKMNFLTGASACMRKAIYELTVIERAEGEDYESRVKFLKKKYPDSDPTFFDVLAHIQEMTSDKIHEQSWDKWDSKYLKLIIETLKNALHDIYVLPKVKADRVKSIQKLREALDKDRKRKRKSKNM